LVSTDFSSEKSELDSVLASGIFDRSPSLAQLLTYVCQKRFEGAEDEIKEYNIAVDALGRPADFDQKRDSIVRVQFYRLRERLADFYQHEGAGHALRIVIPQGQYVPRFVPGSTEDPASELNGHARPLALASAPSAAAEPEPQAPVQPEIAVPARGKSRVFGSLAAAVVILVAAGLMAFAARYLGSGKTAPPPVASPQAAVAGTESTRILVGLNTGPFTDGFGRVWQPDQYFEGGAVVQLPRQAILGTREPRLFQSRRQGQFRYDIPVKDGDYELRLYFAETLFGETNTGGFGGEGSRAFAVQINGKTVKERLDVVGEVGASTADVKVYRDVTPAADGRIHVSFLPLVSVPFLNAIEITPGTPGRLNPIRIVAQPRGYTDAKGNTWEPDRYATGGVIVARAEPPENASDSGLWAGERFGNLTYAVPVAPGTYTVNLYMSERWIGPGLPGGGGAGTRLFDILVNGVALEREFDLFRRASGSNRGFVYTMKGLRPNHQDKLVISLVPVKNFPLVNALEILDEGRSKANPGRY
jgi:hypothetical protein